MLKLAVLAATVAGLSTSVFAADISVPQADLTSPTPVAEWSGAYLGANVAYGSGSSGGGIAAAELGSIGTSGWGGGVQGGYNWTAGNGVVFGVQGDVDWLNENGSVGETTPGGGGLVATSLTASSQLNWTGAATGHLGYSFRSFLPYALAGVALAGNTESLSEDVGGVASASSNTQTHVGYTVGAGVEASLADNVTGFVEGRYSNYGSANYTFTQPAVPPSPAASATEGVSLQDASVRAGLNYHF